MKRAEFLFASDLDGTIFKTFESSPRGWDVHKAYAYSIQEVFGSAGVLSYGMVNGLGNRSPSELVEALITQAPEFLPELIQNAKRYQKEQGDVIGKMVPEAQDGVIIWNPDNPVGSMVQLLVGAKLGYLMDEIGTKDANGKLWPQPCTGFLEFYRDFKALQSKDIPLTFAVVSSGHTAGIRKMFEVWDLTKPDILVTEDDIRPVKYPKGDRRFKPGTLPMAMAHLQWAKKQGLVDEYGDVVHTDAVEAKNRIVYFGDDHKKDGQMAIRSRIPFGHFTEGSTYAPVFGQVLTDHPDTFIFRDWKDISKVLIDNVELISRGRPMVEVMSRLIRMTQVLREQSYGQKVN